MSRKKKKFKMPKPRHKISLRESLAFTVKLEIEMRREMERSITRAFPNRTDRARYISTLIKELDRVIKENES